MTQVGGSDNLTAMLLQFLMERKQLKDRTKQEQAAAYVASLRPGQALGPEGAKQYERHTGVKATPDTVLKPHTFQSALDEKTTAHFLSLPPELRVSAIENLILNTATGEAGRQTRKSFAARGKETEGATGLRATVTEAAAQAVGGKTPNTPEGRELAAAGERHVLGQPMGQTAAGESQAQTEAAAQAAELPARVAEAGTRVAKAGVEKKAQELVSQFLDDPANSAWGKSLRKRGYDPIAVTQAFATGQGGVFTGFMSVDLAKLQAKLAAKQQEGELAAELGKEQIRAAGAVADNLGLPVPTVLALDNATANGQDIFKLGVPPDQVEMYIKGKEISTSAYLRKALSENDPETNLLKTMTDNFKNAKSPEELNAMNEVAAQVAASAKTTGELGKRPPPEQTEARAYWDARAKQNYNEIGIANKRIDKFLGFDALNPDEVQVTPFGFMRGTEIDTTGASTKGKAVKAESGDGKPTFSDPTAARAAETSINWLQDSTLMKSFRGK